MRTDTRHSRVTVYGIAAGLLGMGASVLLGGGVMLPARAQVETTEAIPDSQVEMFSKVLLELEPFRQELRERSESTEDESEKLTIQREHTRKATEIINNYDLTVPDFNRIIIQLREDDDLKSRVESEILRLQKQEAAKP